MQNCDKHDIKLFTLILPFNFIDFLGSKKCVCRVSKIRKYWLHDNDTILNDEKITKCCLLLSNFSEIKLDFLVYEKKSMSAVFILFYKVSF